MVWRDVNTSHKITEIGINSFENNLWNVMCHLQPSKVWLGSFLHSLYEGKCGRKSCELSMFLQSFHVDNVESVAMVLVFLRMVSKHYDHCF